MADTPKKKNGGARPGAGRPPNSYNNITRYAQQKAMDSGDLPHEWLLRIARGEAIPHKRWKITYYQTGPRAGEEKSRELIEEEVYPNFVDRVDAAKAAAPYYAPRLSSQKVQQENTTVVFSDDFSGGNK